MGNIKRPLSVKIIAGLIFNDIEVSDKASLLLFKKLGPLNSESSLFPFDHTSYYNDEMGGGLKRKFLSFRKLKSAEDIYKLKIFTREIEKRFSVSGKRRINIDPGYLTLSRLVLLTTKNYAHRIYLKNGIYAEVTLLFKNKSYQPLEWTYSDYRTGGYINFFNRLRETYIKDLK